MVEQGVPEPFALQVAEAGTEFDEPVRAQTPDTASLCDAIGAMRQAIQDFERKDFPLGHAPMLEMRRSASDLLELLKREIGRISTVLSDC